MKYRWGRAVSAAAKLASDMRTAGEAASAASTPSAVAVSAGEVAAEDVVKTAVEAGFDWAELPISLLMEPEDRLWPALRERLLRTGIGFDACALDLPAGVMVTQRGFNLYVWLEYLKKAVERAASLGCTAFVWSDGRARLLPVEGDVSEAREQVMQFLYLLAEFTGRQGMSVLVEPLTEERTNFLNTPEEVRDFIREIGKENLGLAVSTGELAGEAFSRAAVSVYADVLKLVKIGGLAPAGKGSANGSAFDSGIASVFKAAKYEGPILLPAEAGAEELARCRAFWGESR